MSPASAPRQSLLVWLAVVVLYSVATIAYVWPLFGAFTTVLPHDSGDPGLNAWILWWNAHAVPFTERWWNAPAFFPMKGVFAYSETLLSVAALTTPLQWAGLGPIAAYNVAFVVSFPACAIAAHALAYRLTGRHTAACLAGLAFGFSPYRAAQAPHIQMLWAFWMPLCLLALHRYLDGRRARDLIVAATCWLLSALACGYYLGYFAVLVGLWMLWFVRKRRDWISITSAFAVASLPMVPLILGYRHHLAAIGGSRGRGEIEGFSADLSALWAVSPHAWLPAHWTFAPRPEGELYAGVVIIVLVAVGAARAWRKRGAGWVVRPKPGLLWASGLALAAAVMVWVTGGIRGEWFGVPLSVTRPHRLVGIGIALFAVAAAFDPRFRTGWRRQSAFLFYTLGAAAMVAFAIGPVGRVFDARFMDKAPYFWLMQLPGADALRVPARFAMLYMLCLGQGAALAFTRLVRPASELRWTTVLAVLILADGWVPHLQVASTPVRVPLERLQDDAAVVELPMRDLYDDTAAMLRATVHGRPVVNGFSGFFPSHYAALQSGMMAFDASALDAMREFSRLVVIVDRTKDGEGRYRDMLQSMSAITHEFDTDVASVYSLARRPTGARPTAGRQLPIVRIHATGSQDPAEALIDGDLNTRWQTVRPQADGDAVWITLERTEPIARVELDLAGPATVYPRRLRVSVSDGDGPEETVWEGGTAGAALLAAYYDYRRVPLTISLPAGTTARRVVLTSTGSDPSEPWSMAEIRVIGPDAPTSPQP